MSVARLTINRSSFLDYADVLRNLTPFRTGGSLRGMVGAPWATAFGWGQLDIREGFGKLFRDKWEADKVTYTVLSYATPIAFRDDEGKWHINTEKYSVTTSKSQTKIFAAVAMVSD
jgi:hypothetical protein